MLRPSWGTRFRRLSALRPGPERFANNWSSLHRSRRPAAAELAKLHSEEAEARHNREILEWAALISTRAEEELRALEQREAAEREAWRRAELFTEQLLEGWNPNQPRSPQGQPDGGRWVKQGGGGGGGMSHAPHSGSAGISPGSTSASAGSPFTFVGLKRSKQGTQGPAPATTPAQSSGSSARGSAPPVRPNPNLNADGVEVAGPGPEVAQSYKDKVQKALETLDPDVARWWKANSVGGVVRSRTARFWQSNYYSQMEKDSQGNEKPVVTVDANLTPGEAAQAIIAEAASGWFADSVGVFYKKYKYARRGDLADFREWQKGSTAEAAQLASVLAEFYVNSIATLTPAGDLTVTVGDVAENGPHWNQLLSILPYIGHLPVLAVTLRIGGREAKIPKAVAQS